MKLPFTKGETFLLKGLRFKVAALTKRGLALRLQQKESGTTANALAESKPPPKTVQPL